MFKQTFKLCPRRGLALASKCVFFPTRGTCSFGLKLLPIHASEEEESSSSSSFSSHPWFIFGGAVFAGCSSASYLQSRKDVSCEATIPIQSASSGSKLVDVGGESEFANAELYDISLFGGKSSILVTTIGGKWYCTGASCTHYSAPLVNGVMAPDNYGGVKSYHVSCPWHDAEFDLKTGKCVNGPALQAIPTYPIQVKNARVLVTIPNDMNEAVEPTTAKRNPKNNQVIAVIGGGPASMSALETLRQEGYDGRLVFITMEKHLPYDRPVLSKNLYASVEHISLRGQDFADRLEIEFMPETEVVRLDSVNSTLHFKNGKTMTYDKVLCCAGAEPRQIPVEGHQAPNIFPLRRPEHAEKIQQYARKGKKVVVVGSSFIGMEVAATLNKKGAKVSVIGMEQVPFERVLGKQIGEVFARSLRDNGLEFCGPAVVSKYVLGDDGKVKGVQLKDGRVLECDAVVLGAGVVPTCKNFVEGVTLLRDGSIACDPFLKTREGPGNFWAAGDCVTFPWYKTGTDARIEHWDVAYQQGRVAAKNMLGAHVPFANIPFFWTMIFGKSLRYAGYTRDYNYLHVEGDLDKGDFVAYYLKDDTVEAVATCNRDPVAVGVIELMKLGIMPKASEIRSGKYDAAALLEKLREYNRLGKPAPAS